VASFSVPGKLPVLAKIDLAIKKFCENNAIYFLSGKTHDFLGVNYYFHHRAVCNEQKRGIDYADAKKMDKEVSSLGWEIYPRGLTDVLIELKKYNLPIIICENGIATNDDNQREEYIKNHLQAVHNAVEKGADVQGYFYWSLLDNFEWAEGYKPRFGLVEVDYKTQKRRIRKSAKVYSLFSLKDEHELEGLI